MSRRVLAMAAAVLAGVVIGLLRPRRTSPSVQRADVAPGGG